MKKLSTEEFKEKVKNQVQNEYTVLGDYKTAKEKILIRHNVCGNNFYITPDKFLFQKQRCPLCTKEKQIKGMKKTTDDFKREVFLKVKDEYEVLGEYINNHTKIEMLHKTCNNKFNVRPDNFLNNNTRCPYCFGNNKKNTAQFKEEVENLTEKEYTVLGEYKNSKTKILIQHNTCGNKFLVLPNSFLGGSRCPYCNKSRKKEIDEMKQLVFDAVKDEYSIINEPTNVKDIEMKHNLCGHIFYPSLRIFLNKNTRCPKCKGVLPKTTEDIKKEIENIWGDEYTLIGEYKNCRTKITVHHKVCNKEYDVIANCLTKRGNQCPYCCKNSISYEEKEVLNYIKTILPKETVLENNKNALQNNKEIDIYIPSKKIGIEYNGLYWHSDSFLDYKYHQEKTKLANSKGIRLIQIFEDEWIYKKDLVKDKLSHIFKQNNDKKIFARKTTIKEIPSSVRNKFLLENHIQGEDKANISLGLFFEQELIGVMSFCKPRLNLGNKTILNKTFELSRFATKINYSVVGGFSKMLAYAIKNYDIEDVYTYADLRWTDEQNNVYLKNHFIFEHYTSPNYFYIVKGKRENRFKYRKSELKKIFPKEYDETLSEKEICKKAGLKRIYDCGNIKYKLDQEYIKEIKGK